MAKQNTDKPHKSPSPMDEKAMAQETRKQKRLSQLGTDYPTCRLCLEDDWRCLEAHHLEGCAYGNTLVILCRYCHRKVTDDQKDHPSSVGVPPTTLERIGRFLLNLADLLGGIAHQLKAFGAHLIEQARATVHGTEPKTT